MREIVTIKAHAKINLGLKILSKRPDGFHEIRTTLQRVSLHDTLRITQSSANPGYTGPAVTAESRDNLCLRAVEAFRKRFGASRSADIQLEKYIPVGAGLGGGSSDAAAVLIALAKIYQIAENDPDLPKIASQLGSDVSFFMTQARAATAEGRGEKLKSTRSLDDRCWILIVYPGFEISTAWAYSVCDKFLTLNKNILKLIGRDLNYSRDKFGDFEMGNDFEKPVFAAYPELSRERDRLLEAGAYHAALSGSGSALFGIFDGEAVTRAAAHGCQSWLSFVCRPY